MLQRTSGHGGGLLLDIQTWLSGVPVLCDLICKPERDRPSRGWSHDNARMPAFNAGPCNASNGDMGTVCDHATGRDMELANRRQQLEAELETDLKRLAEERKEGLHRIDWELAEAVETLHAETARRANERISQHRAALSEIERRMQAGEDITPEKAREIHAAHLEGQGYDELVGGDTGSDNGSDRGSEDESGGSESDADNEPGVWGSMVQFVRRHNGTADGAQHASQGAGTSPSHSSVGSGRSFSSDRDRVLEDFRPPLTKGGSAWFSTASQRHEVPPEMSWTLNGHDAASNVKNPNYRLGDNSASHMNGASSSFSSRMSNGIYGSGCGSRAGSGMPPPPPPVAPPPFRRENSSQYGPSFDTRSLDVSWGAQRSWGGGW